MRRNLLSAVAVIALGAAVVAGYVFDPLDLRGRADLARALTYRGKVAVIGGLPFGLSPEGTSFIRADATPELERALDATDESALLAALAHTRIQALLVAQPIAPAQLRASLRARLARYDYIAGLHGLYLSRRAALYAPAPNQALARAELDALAVVARGIIGGARPPRPSSFPDAMRRLQPVEVMVLLRDHTRARLWRSARGTSIATALVTAAEVARQRWQEREQAMGEALSSALPKLDLDVALLEDDGTIADRDPAFIDRVFFPVHGVGYERKGAWRYLLPDATRFEGKGRASRAYRKLFVDDGLPEDSFGRFELRLYRLVVETIATSAAQPLRDALSPVASPDEVLAKPPR